MRKAEKPSQHSNSSALDREVLGQMVSSPAVIRGLCIVLPPGGAGLPIPRARQLGGALPMKSTIFDDLADRFCDAG
jgi:hypothetical protein